VLTALASLALAASASAQATLKSTPPVPLPSRAPAAKSVLPAERKPAPAQPHASGPLPRTGLDTSLEALAGSLLLALGVSVRIATAPSS
jgi:hypothetical protein